jgi:hypothetical protein
MQVIGDRNRGSLDFAELARQSGGNGIDFGTPPSSCSEERQEPNDSVAAAAAISAGADFTGGICASDKDFYQVDLQGSWSIAMTHTQGVGDLDVYVWDTSRNAPLEQGGRKVGSNSDTDNEFFTHTGPAVIAVEGWEGAQAPYRLQLIQ